MITETSNLLHYSPEQLSLMIAAIEMKINDEYNTLAVRQYFSNGEDLTDTMVQLNSEGIKKASQNLDDLYGIRVALLNAWTSVKRMKQIECN